MQVIYIAHPISGDIKGILEKIRLITRKLNLSNKDIVPFAPYWLDCHALDDTIPTERARGIKNNITLFKRGFIDEVWLYGHTISDGMLAEIKLASKLGIKVVPQTPHLSKMLDALYIL